MSFLLRLESLFTDAADKLAAKEFRENLKDHHLDGYKLTQTKFKDQVDHVIAYKTFSKEFPSWANFYLSSLREVVKDKNGNLERIVHIGDVNGDWITGLILYNFSLFYKHIGPHNLKKCPKCSKYFSNKGEYAKYCSEVCKKQSKENEATDAAP